MVIQEGRRNDIHCVPLQRDKGNVSSLDACLSLSWPPPNHSLQLRCIFSQEELVLKKGWPGEVVSTSYAWSCPPYSMDKDLSCRSLQLRSPERAKLAFIHTAMWMTLEGESWSSDSSGQIPAWPPPCRPRLHCGPQVSYPFHRRALPPLSS